MSVDPKKLEEFVGKGIGDLGAAISALLVHVGDKLGLYKAMAGAGALSPGELAKKTQTDERYIREWLCNQAAGGYVNFDSASQKFSLSEEQAMCLANEQSPAFLPGGFESLASLFVDEPKVTAAFRNGKGSDGTSTTHACSRAPRDSFAPDTMRTWSRPGSLLSKAQKPSLRRVREWPMSDAVTAHRRLYWRRPIPILLSTASTTTAPRSIEHGFWRRRRALVTAQSSIPQ